MLWLLCPDAGMELCGKMRRAQVTWPGIVMPCTLLTRATRRGAPHIVMSRISSIHQTAHCSHYTPCLRVSQFLHSLMIRQLTQLTSCSGLTRQTRSTHSWAQPSPFRPSASKTTKYQRIWEIHTRAIENEENEVNLPNYVSSFDDVIAAEILNILLSWDLGPPQVPR